MNKEEFVKIKSEQMWSELQSNPETLKELVDLGVYSMDEFMDKMTRGDLPVDKYFIRDYMLRNGEAYASIKEAFLPPEHISFQISYNGRNILGVSAVPIPHAQEGFADSFAQSIRALFLMSCNPAFYVAAINPDHPNHATSLEYLRGYSSLSSHSQIYARFSLGAAFVGEDLVNKALIAADCLTLEEMKEMAEADEFNEQDS